MKSLILALPLLWISSAYAQESAGPSPFPFAITTNLTLIQKTTSPISVPIAAISLLGAGILPSVSVTVPGVSAGDFVLTSFNGTPPTSITISAVQATVANTVLITPQATAALVVGTQNLSLNFVWMH